MRSVRDLSAAIAFTLAIAGPAHGATPTFKDPVALVTWLLQNSMHGFDPTDDKANAAVFSPGLRAAIRLSMARSKRLNEPPCGADGDIILDTQETGVAENVKLAATPTAPDRSTVAATFDIVGHHADRRYLAVNLAGIWKLENILEANGHSLRRTLDCK